MKPEPSARLKLYFERLGLPFPPAKLESRDPVVIKSMIMISSNHIGIVAKLGVEKELSQGFLKSVEIDSSLMLALLLSSTVKRARCRHGEIACPHPRGGCMARHRPGKR